MLDYALFRRILEELHGAYPRALHPNDLACMKHLMLAEKSKPLAYLREHGLIAMSLEFRKEMPVFGKAAITKHGIDFLMSDGGLSALAAPVIRIAPESLIAIIDAALAARGVPADRRGAIQKALGVAEAETVKTLVRKLVEAGIAHLPDIDSLFRMMA